MRNAQPRVAKRARRLRFEQLVNQVYRTIPDRVQRELDNVEFVVENEPESRHLGTDEGELFGLYQGTPLNERDSFYTMMLPDVITLFRGPLERAFPDRSELKSQIRITLLHEIAHHLGIDEDDVTELGLA
jgi:predicted Zn-dependent protease with MMP-like domain